MDWHPNPRTTFLSYPIHLFLLDEAEREMKSIWTPLIAAAN